jgi:hypothetical protein
MKSDQAGGKGQIPPDLVHWLQVLQIALTS